MNDPLRRALENALQQEKRQLELVRQGKRIDKDAEQAILKRIEAMSEKLANLS